MILHSQKCSKHPLIFLFQLSLLEKHNRNGVLQVESVLIPCRTEAKGSSIGREKRPIKVQV